MPHPTDLRERFARDGFVTPLTAMTPAAAAGYRGQLEAAEARFAAEPALRKCLRRYPNLVLPFVDEITRLPAITDTVAAILGEDLLVLDPPFFIKEAQTPHYVSWHQDLHYWGLAADDEVTAWVALSPATVESGCMRFVPGSHRQVVDHVDTHAEGNLLTRGQELAVEVDESEARDVVLQPGQFSLHHGRVFHASHANRSDDRRIGLAIRYIPAGMRQIAGADMAAMLVRGQDRFHHFRECRPPSGVFLAEDLAHWRDIQGARDKVMYRET
ncbi:MAG: phytanoyl-CoA dioxygenase family protein [Alphaproteobacteria bacterium]|nr:phytanoyl-CoA dioxygenase family protein [Alphaproteobacteria bacterium]MCB9931655.1 phytanoyl-CoA dioxygenase family protein [Alphaproteobacteria bacterium]